MKNKILTLVFGIAVATAAHSQILYWTVSDYQGGTSYDKWAYARIFSLTGTKPGSVLKTFGGDTSNYIAQKANDGVYASYIDSDSYSAANSFYIELYSSQNATDPYAWSYLVKKSDLKTFVDDASFAQVPPKNMINGFTVVPEPTSGLMLLLGAAMLGLRRKRIA